MKRFLLFAFEDYYPKGGWGDFKMDGDSPDAIRPQFVWGEWRTTTGGGKCRVSEMRITGCDDRFDVYQIVDSETGKVIEEDRPPLDEWEKSEREIAEEKERERIIAERQKKIDEIDKWRGAEIGCPPDEIIKLEPK